MAIITSTYRFLPWARRGLADKIKGADTGAALPVRAKVPVGLTVTGASEAKYDLSLYGPGDVLGIDTRLIVRTDPRPNTTDVEANYFPAIEFDAPDFPWLFTPAVSGTNNQLRPWCVLIVIDLSIVDAPRAEPGHPLPVIVVPGEARATELPDLADSWAWAHTQVVAPSTGTTATTIATSLSADPTMNVARIVAPRRLEPGKRYAACLVPAFDAGVARGLIDSAPKTGNLGPAWSDAVPGDVRLPVYFHWEFSTGPAGDFETLARRLKPADPPASAGIESMYIGAAGPDLPAIPPTDRTGYLDMDGPLRAPNRSNAVLADVPAAVQTALQTTLNAAAAQAESGPTATTPVLGPPLYGQWHANQHTVPADTPAWLRELNLDPRARAAAGLGAEIERRNQEDFMQWAWEQVGDILKANALLNQSRLSMEALYRVHKRHVATLPPDRALQFSAPLHSRAVQGGMTIKAAIEQSSLPDGAADPALRRLVSPRNRFVRSAKLRSPAPPAPPAPPAGTPPPAPAPASASSLVSKLAAGQLTVDPTRFIPNGLAGHAEAIGFVSGLFDFEVSLAFTGLPVIVTGSVVAGFGTEAAALATAPVPPASSAGPAPAAPQLVPFALAAAKSSLIARTNPRATVVARVQSMVTAGGAPVAAAPSVQAAASKLSAASASPGVGVAPTFDRILAAPELDVPVFRYLAQLDPSRFMPGVGEIPAESIMLLETNPRFIEALLVGLNYEMNRELLWREFPTDQRGTPFKNFWGWSDGGHDIAPINTWPAKNALGDNSRSGSGGQIVMLIRGRLLQRYPNTSIFAWRAKGSRLVNPPAPADLRNPVFSGVLGSDIAYAGFDLTDADLAQGDGWFFVLQEQPTEPRFGFDEGTGAPAPALTSWSDASWDDTGTAPGHYLRLAGNRLKGVKIGTASFVDHAGHLAYITIQKPVCVALHAHTMINAITP
ncbi:MAG TPA: hypothetical protein VK636_21545 [Gemmatimonadaceae bacterium]|nr:hypothetical protein [Gemmatimonadaceae bacterium]